jgi:hypothetical protein
LSQTHYRSKLCFVKDPLQGGIALGMNKKILLLGAVAVFCLSMPLWAADVDGKWVAERQGMQGGTTQITFDFLSNGSELTGTVTTTRGENAISEGKIEGDTVSFAVVTEVNGNEMKTLYKGKVAGDQITFTTERQGGMMGGPGGGMGAPPAGGQGGPGGMGAPPGGGQGAPGGPRPSRELIAKRVK